MLDRRSLIAGYQRKANAVQYIQRGPHADGTPCHLHEDGSACSMSCRNCSCGTRGAVKAIRRTHNLRTTVGAQQQAQAMGLAFANATAGIVAGTSTASSATTLTDTGQAWTTNQFQGMIVVVGTVFGIVLSNTAAVLTVDKWHNPILTDTTGTTPGATSAYFLVAGAMPAHYIALTNDAAAPAAGDTTLASEITTNGLARALGSFTYTSGGPDYVIAKTFTASGTQAAQKAGLFNASAGGQMWFENNSWVSVSMASGDTLAFSWQVNI